MFLLGSCQQTKININAQTVIVGNVGSMTAQSKFMNLFNKTAVSALHINPCLNFLSKSVIALFIGLSFPFQEKTLVKYGLPLVRTLNQLHYVDCII